jgi:hypothetical protein
LKTRAPIFALIAVAALLVAGFVTLYRLRLGRGDFFPPYSTLRSDPLGTRVLHESLASLPNQQVTRWMLPLAQLPSAPKRTIILAGLTLERWSGLTKDEFAALDSAARNGSRLVIAFRAEETAKETRDPSFFARERNKKKEEEAAKKEKAAEPKTDKKSSEAADPDEKPVTIDPAKMWELKVEQRALVGGAHRGPLAPLALPLEIPWKADVFFDVTAPSPWQTMYRRGLRPVMIERRLGLGSLVLASDAYFLSNESLQRDHAAPLLVWAVGALPQIEFVESHLGVVDDPGVAALARRYGLAAGFFTFLVLAALFVWRRLALFAPATEERPGLMLEYHQTAGLEALLRRSVAPAELVPACAAEWRSTARPSDVARVDAVLKTPPPGNSPAQLYNAAVRILRRR